MVEGAILYKLPYFGSSKIFAKRVFWRLRNQILDGHISGLEQDRDNLKPLLPTKSPISYRLVPLANRSRDHITSGLPFLASRSHTNRRKRYRGNVPGRGTWALGAKMGPVLGSHEIKFAYQNAKKTRKTRWIEEGRYFGGKLRPK